MNMDPGSQFKSRKFTNVNCYYMTRDINCLQCNISTKVVLLYYLTIFSLKLSLIAFTGHLVQNVRFLYFFVLMNFDKRNGLFHYLISALFQIQDVHKVQQLFVRRKDAENIPILSPRKRSNLDPFSLKINAIVPSPKVTGEFFHTGYSESHMLN